MGPGDAKHPSEPTSEHLSQYETGSSQDGSYRQLKEPQTGGQSIQWQLKTDQIELACEESDLAALAALARSDGGLLTDDLRRKAWPVLLGFHKDKEARLGDTEYNLPETASLPAHRDEDQVQLDVNRSFVYYPKSLSESQLEARREDLFNVIVPTLRRHPKLCYFQGFHDIAQVMLLVLGKKDATLAASYLSLLRIRDFMLPSLSPSLVHLQLLPAIIFAADPALYQHLRGVRPFFALAATLTLYAHEVEDYGQIARLYDFLLAHEAAVSIYLFAVIILSRKQQLFEIPSDDPDLLNFALSKLPRPLNLEYLIADAMEIFSKHPPRTLPFRAWRKICSASVLKTTQSMLSRKAGLGDVGTVQAGGTLEEGEDLFSKQLIQLKRQERRQELFRVVWKFRKHIVGILTAAAVAGLSVWIQRYGLGRWPWVGNFGWIAARLPLRRP